MPNIIRFILLVISSSLFLTACKTKTKITQTPTTYEQVHEHIKKITRAEPQFSTANVNRMTVNIEIGNRKFTTQAACRMRTDSCIHISILPLLGVEMFKVEITPQKIVVFDKLNKKMYPLSFEQIQQKFDIPIGFSDLQSMLSNRFFTAGYQGLDTPNCKLGEVVNGLLRIDYNTAHWSQQSYINTDNRIENMELQAQKSAYNMQIQYADFMLFEALTFPQTIQVTANTANQTAKFNFKILRAVFNTTLQFTAIDPSSYTTGEIKQLMHKY